MNKDLVNIQVRDKFRHPIMFGKLSSQIINQVYYQINNVQVDNQVTSNILDRLNAQISNQVRRQFRIQVDNQLNMG